MVACGGSLSDYPGMADVLLDRLTFRPEGKQAGPIPWPDGFAPAPQETVLDYDGSVQPARVLVITWTAAEGMALADVLTPGVHVASWTDYTKNWLAYEKQLTGRSPARESKRLGSYHMTQIGQVPVCCVKSELHPATDAASLPTAQLVAQLIAETGCELVITTGTAGGAGDGTQLGDINVSSAIHADFTTRLKGHTWSTGLWGCPALTGEQEAYLSRYFADLAASGGQHLPPLYVKRQPQVQRGHAVSTDFFAYDTENDHFGLRAYDPSIRMVEMDDAAVAAGAQAAGPKANGGVPVLSVRNASDPVMPDASEESGKEAEKIYRDFGYWTTVNSVIGTWAVIAGLNEA